MTLVWSPGYAPVDEYYDNVSLLLYGNGTNGSTTITDNSPSPKTVTAVGNAQISTAQSKFGGASILLDGSGDYLTLPVNQDFNLSTLDFTIEGWVNMPSPGGSYNCIFSVGFPVQIYVNNSTIEFYASNSDGASYFINALVGPASSISANTWAHFAVTRSGTSFRAFVNGISGSIQTSSSAVFVTTATPSVGSASNSFFFNGYIDDFRITKGVARYTSNFIPPTASFPDLSPTGRLTVAYTIDSDAAAYIAAVEAADGQALETATRTAIDSFVKGCKNDGIWNAIKASCILAGARTLAGALVPLVGTAPTNNNFVSGDYNRETGLVGNGSTKYLNTNRNNNADPQDNHSQGVFVHTAQPSGSAGYIGVATGTTGATHVAVDYVGNFAVFRSRAAAYSSASGLQSSTGLLGMTRSSGSSFTFRVASASTTSNTASETSASGNVYVFARNVSDAINVPTSGRLQFYWIGESLDLALLDTRVTSLINAFAAAIP